MNLKKAHTDVGCSDKRIQELPWLGFLSEFLCRLLVRLVQGYCGGFSSGDVSPAAFRTDRPLDLNGLRDHLSVLPLGLGLFMSNVLVFVCRHREGRGFRSYVGRRFK